jgi:hypothetical protein
LKIASWAARSPENEESYGHRLPSIFKAINELRIAIGEKFTSADLDVFVFDCGETYDSAKMDDAYSDGRQLSGKRAPETVVGTTGVGLVQNITEGSAKDGLLLISPPKIVLGSTLQEALEPVQSTRSKKKKKPVENMDGADPQEARVSSKPKADAITMDTT